MSMLSQKKQNRGKPPPGFVVDDTPKQWAKAKSTEAEASPTVKKKEHIDFSCAGGESFPGLGKSSKTGGLSSKFRHKDDQKFQKPATPWTQDLKGSNVTVKTKRKGK